MVSLFLLSHSAKVVEGIKDIAAEMAKEAPIFVAGGTPDGGLGSDYELIKDTLLKAYNTDGVVILFDLGSSAMTAGLVLDELDDDVKSKIEVSNAPLVEGAIVAAVEIASGSKLEDVMGTLKDIEMVK